MKTELNNRITFGAFRPVKTDLTRAFVITLNTNKEFHRKFLNPIQVDKGLEKFIKRQSKNKIYDVACEYDKNGELKFSVIQNSNGKIVSQYMPDSTCPTGFERAVKLLTDSLKILKDKKTNNEINNYKLIKETAKDTAKFMYRVIKSQFDRTELLPSGMRAAGHRANHLEKLAQEKTSIK